MRHTGEMSPDAQSKLASVPPGSAVAQAANASRLQFSLSDLLLTTLIIAVVCAVLPWLGSIWIVPFGLAVLSVANFILAVRRRSNWRMLRLGHWHFAIWLALAAASAGCTVYGCLEYNEIAGTDKTPRHIVQISAASLAGPMVGPVANPGAGETAGALTCTAILFTIQLIAASPFLQVRRIVPFTAALFCWTAFLGATILWFFGAMISLGFFLS